MAAGEYEIVIEKGSTFDRTFQYTVPDGRAIDLTGAYCRFLMKDHKDDTQVIVDLYSNVKAESDKYIQIVDPPTVGMMRLFFAASLIDEWNFNRANYEFTIYFPSGHQEMILRGAVRLVHSISNTP